MEHTYTYMCRGHGPDVPNRESLQKMVRRSVHFFILYSGRPARAVSRPRLITARAALLVMCTRGQTSYDHAKYT